MFVIASRMQGTLVDKDLRAVPNVRVTRTWEWAWNGRKGSDVSTTDARGHFEFPQVKRFSLTAGVLPHEPVITLEITASGPEGPVLLIYLSKRDYSDGSELPSNATSFVCRIDLTPGRTDAGYWGTVVEVK